MKKILLIFFAVLIPLSSVYGKGWSGGRGRDVPIPLDTCWDVEQKSVKPANHWYTLEKVSYTMRNKGFYKGIETKLFNFFNDPRFAIGDKVQLMEVWKRRGHIDYGIFIKGSPMCP